MAPTVRSGNCDRRSANKRRMTLLPVPGSPWIRAKPPSRTRACSIRQQKSSTLGGTLTAAMGREGIPLEPVEGQQVLMTHDLLLGQIAGASAGPCRRPARGAEVRCWRQGVRRARRHGRFYPAGRSGRERYRYAVPPDRSGSDPSGHSSRLHA